MKSAKTEFKYFTITQWKKEDSYLREHHQNGWKFINVSFIGFYHFEKCEPEDVVYQLDFNTEGISHKTEYIQLFQDCGWEYLQDFFGYSYFRKPYSKMNGDEEIFCDDDSRAEMLLRVFKVRMLPLLFIFFLIILPNIFIQSRIHTKANQILLVAFIFLFIAFFILFIHFGLQYLKYRKNRK